MSDNTGGKAVLFSKMAAVMGELTRIPKNGFNKDQNYQFATSEDIKQAVREAMANNKLCLFVDMPEYESSEIIARSGTKGTRIRGRMVFTICCGETGEEMERSLWGEATDYQDKAFNKLYTTLEKYFLISTFLISTGDDNDSDSSNVEQIAEVSPPRIQKSAQKPKPEAPLVGFPAIVAEVNAELGREEYNIPHAQNTCKKLIEDFKMPSPGDTEVLAGVKQILLDHANAPKDDAPSFDGIFEGN